MGVSKPHHFWAWPGTTSAAVTLVGLLMLIAGFVMPKPKKEDKNAQRQQSGNNSINLQAGGDIHIGDPSE
jgi:hypothetical protein